MHDFYKLLVLVFVLIFVLIVILLFVEPYTLSKLTTYFRIKMAARRLMLRDKGKMEDYPHPEGTLQRIHSFCNTRIRIGIRDNGLPTQYCWRCEQLGFENYGSGPGSNPDPDGGEPIPDDIRKDVVVVQFKPKKVA
jgi:hypothetical protein